MNDLLSEQSADQAAYPDDEGMAVQILICCSAAREPAIIYRLSSIVRRQRSSLWCGASEQMG